MSSPRKPTEKDLALYMDLERQRAQIDQKLELLRTTIIRYGRPAFDVGELQVTVTEASRLQAKPREKVIEIAGARLAARLFRRISFQRVSVKRKAA